MKTLLLALTCLFAVSAEAQFPASSSKAAGFDPVRIEVMHETVRRLVDQRQHAGIITLLVRDERSRISK